MALLFVRTGNAGADPDFQIPDLGITIPSGTSWFLLSASSPSQAFGSSGQFSARELRDSQDLFEAISNSDLEWSSDGINVNAADDYTADFMLMQDFSDDFLNLTSGIFVVPNGDTLPASGIEGQAYWDSDNNALYIWDGAGWSNVATSSGISDHGSLSGLSDDDHPQYAHLSQSETITGNWSLNPGATNPNITLVPRVSTPSTNLSDGSLAVINGLLCIYDGTRSKWLSVDRKLLIASKSGNTKDVYLRVGDSIASLQTGYRLLYNATITGIFLQTDVAATWTLEVRKNGAATVIASLSSGGATGTVSTITNIDINQGDELQFYANTGGTTIIAPVVGIEMSWRP